MKAGLRSQLLYSFPLPGEPKFPNLGVLFPGETDVDQPQRFVSSGTRRATQAGNGQTERGLSFPANPFGQGAANRRAHSSLLSDEVRRKARKLGFRFVAVANNTAQKILRTPRPPCQTLGDSSPGTPFSHGEGFPCFAEELPYDGFQRLPAGGKQGAPEFLLHS